jgi:hypothetical protein
MNSLCCIYSFLPESPRWLVSVGKFAEAKTVLVRVAKVNRRIVDVDDLVNQVLWQD